MIENMPMCTHLSNWILSKKFSFGKAEPGKVNKMVAVTNHKTPGKKEGFIFFNAKFLAILSEDSFYGNKKRNGDI